MINQILANVTPGSVLLFLLALVVLCQVFIRVRYSNKVKRAGGVHAPDIGPNPLTAPIWIYRIGVAQASDRLLDFFNSTFKQHGSPDCPNIVEVNITGGRRTLFTSEPEHIKTILTSKFSDYGKGAEFHRVWKPFLGDSIFTTDGQLWQDSRNLIRPMFIKNRVSDLHIFERWTDVMIKQLPKKGETVDLMDYLYRMTIDVITDFLLGESVNSLENPRSEFVEAFKSVQRWQTMLTVLIIIDRAIPRWKYLKGIRVLEDFIVPFINRTLSLQEDELEKISKSDQQFTFLHALAKHTRDPKVIRDQLIAVLLAGRDTTAATLSWTFYELSNNPTAYAKLRNEVLAVVGPSRSPTYDDLKNMRYLSHTLNETLRLYPAVPFNVRYALSDSSLPSTNPRVHPDVSVVAGDAVFYSTIAMQRREDLYPPTSPTFAHPSVFSPERWDVWQPKPWQYVPFNGGPRICVGQNFALTEMAYVVVRMCQRFERVEYRGDWHAQFHKVEIVGTPGRGVKVGLFEATNSDADEKV